MKNTQKYCKIEVTGFQSLCNRLGKLEEENQKLKAQNKIIADELTYFQEYAADLEDRCRELSKQNHDLLVETSDMKFAREHLGVPMSEADIAEEKAIAAGEAHYAKTWNIACEGDDF